MKGVFATLLFLFTVSCEKDYDYVVEEDWPNGFLLVRVQKPLSKKRIHEIAEKLRNKYSDNEELLIYYLLPGMNKSEVAWAISHYNPNLNIEILRPELEREE